MEESTLSPKQISFCQQYLIDANATQAAIRAGYSVKTATNIASRLLGKVNIQDKISELKALQSDRLQVDADWVLKKYIEIARFELRDVCTIENKKIEFKPQSQWNEPAWTAITTIEQNNRGEIKIKAESKLPALRALGEHFGMFSDLNIALATLKTYGIPLKRDADNNWFLDSGE